MFAKGASPPRMAAPIRPPVWPPAPSDIRPGRNDARAAAQKAFLEAAMAGQSAAKVEPPAAKPEPAVSPAQAVRAVTQTESMAAADKLPRPGSIVDIYV